jgi:hypothetical protein
VTTKLVIWPVLQPLPERATLCTVTVDNRTKAALPHVKCTSSLGPGIFFPTHVAGASHAPPAFPTTKVVAAAR